MNSQKVQQRSRGEAIIPISVIITVIAAIIFLPKLGALTWSSNISWIILSVIIGVLVVGAVHFFKFPNTFKAYTSRAFGAVDRRTYIIIGVAILAIIGFMLWKHYDQSKKGSVGKTDLVPTAKTTPAHATAVSDAQPAPTAQSGTPLRYINGETAWSEDRWLWQQERDLDAGLWYKFSMANVQKHFETKFRHNYYDTLYFRKAETTRIMWIITFDHQTGEPSMTRTNDDIVRQGDYEVSPSKNMIVTVSQQLENVPVRN